MAFALHHQIRNKYGIKSFFTRPYTFQGKGTLEKRRGLIRAFLPKEIDFKKKDKNLIIVGSSDCEINLNINGIKIHSGASKIKMDYSMISMNPYS